MKRQPYTVVDLTPEPMRSKLRVQGQTGIDVARFYLEASDETRGELQAFFDGGPSALAQRLLETRTPVVDPLAVGCPHVFCSAPVAERCKRGGLPSASPHRARVETAQRAAGEDAARDEERDE